MYFNNVCKIIQIKFSKSVKRIYLIPKLDIKNQKSTKQFGFKS